MYFSRYVEPTKPVAVFGVPDYLLIGVTVVMAVVVLVAAYRTFKKARRRSRG